VKTPKNILGSPYLLFVKGAVGWKLNLDDVYRLGLWVQRFRDASLVFPKAKGEGSLIYGLELVRETLEEYKIGRDCMEDLSQWKKKLDSKYDEKSEIDKGDAKQLVLDWTAWNERLHRDLREKRVVEIELRSGLNPDELLKMSNKQPSEYIQENVWNQLTQIEKSDFSDAARCLLLGTATPSAMVALRGAEASIRNYYRCITNKEPGEKTWRQITQELRNEAANLKVENTFIEYLDYIGDAKRNIAQHPNCIYSLREAVMIFMQVMSLVEDIYAHI
jgi:hypothetical protein